MKPVIVSDFFGQKFNCLLVVNAGTPRYNKQNRLVRMVKCLCDCGVIKEFILTDIRSGHTKCCGCGRSSALVGDVKKHPLHSTWRAMKQRCYSKSHVAYKNYGGRGITVCEEWRRSSIAFIIWCLGNGWKPGLQLDREDNNEGYGPTNCRFVTNQVNCLNKRNTIRILYKGELKTTHELSAISIGLPYNIIGIRVVQRGWDVEKAISTPVRRKNKAVK